MPPNTMPSPAPMPQSYNSGGLPHKHNNTLITLFILTLVVLMGTIGFAAWAFMSREDYKSNSDQKSAAAVAAAEKTLSAKKDSEFAEKEKSPLKEYKGSQTFGSLVIQYPKTWSAYVIESDKASIPIDGYLHPNYVPNVQSGTSTAFALHFQVINSPYDQELKKYDNFAKTGDVRITPYVAPKVTNVTGVKVEGQVEQGKQGTAVLFPLRDKTLRIVTESTSFNADFTNIILANLTFVP